MPEWLLLEALRGSSVSSCFLTLRRVFWFFVYALCLSKKFVWALLLVVVVVVTTQQGPLLRQQPSVWLLLVEELLAAAVLLLLFWPWQVSLCICFASVVLKQSLAGSCLLLLVCYTLVYHAVAMSWQPPLLSRYPQLPIGSLVCSILCLCSSGYLVTLLCPALLMMKARRRRSRARVSIAPLLEQLLTACRPQLK